MCSHLKQPSVLVCPAAMLCYVAGAADMLTHCSEVCFASFLSGGFTTMAGMNPLEKKLAKRTLVH